MSPTLVTFASGNEATRYQQPPTVPSLTCEAVQTTAEKLPPRKQTFSSQQLNIQSSTYSCNCQHIKHLRAITPGICVPVLGLTLVCKTKVHLLTLDEKVREGGGHCRINHAVPVPFYFFYHKIRKLG